MIIGLNFAKVLVEKNFEKGKHNVNKVNTKTNIVSIEEEKITVPNKKSFRAGFSFLVSYEPNLAKILIEGSLLYLDDSEKISKIIESWKKKDLPGDIRLELLNYIMLKCNVKALSLEDYVNLPPHLPMPKFNKEEKKSKEEAKADYTG